MFRLVARAVLRCDIDEVLVGIVNFRYNRVQLESRIVGPQEGRGFAFDKGVETSLVLDIVVGIRILVEREIVAGEAKYLAGLLGRICSFPVPLPPLNGLLDGVVAREPSSEAECGTDTVIF